VTLRSKPLDLEESQAKSLVLNVKVGVSVFITFRDTTRLQGKSNRCIFHTLRLLSDFYYDQGAVMKHDEVGSLQQQYYSLFNPHLYV
jgi:hypothetical protein